MEILNIAENIEEIEADLCKVVDGHLVYKLPQQKIEIQRETEELGKYVEIPTSEVVRLRFAHGLTTPVNYHLSPRLTPEYVGKGLIITDSRLVDNNTVEVSVVSMFSTVTIRNDDQVFVLRLEPLVWVRSVELPEGSKSF